MIRAQTFFCRQIRKALTSDQNHNTTDIRTSRQASWQAAELNGLPGLESTLHITVYLTTTSQLRHEERTFGKFACSTYLREMILCLKGTFVLKKGSITLDSIQQWLINNGSLEIMYACEGRYIWNAFPTQPLQGRPRRSIVSGDSKKRNTRINPFYLVVTFQ